MGDAMKDDPRKKPKSFECPNCQKILTSRLAIPKATRINCPACKQPFVVGETESARGQPVIESPLERFTRWAGMGMMFTGAYWIALPIFFVWGVYVLEESIESKILGFGCLMVVSSVSLLVTGFFLHRQKTSWFMIPACLLAILGGLVVIGFLISVFNGLMNDLGRFPPPHFHARVKFGITLGAILLGPISLLGGVGGAVAVIRAYRARRPS
jgi:hypothetical protein